MLSSVVVMVIVVVVVGAIAMTSLFLLVLHFSENASKLFNSFVIGSVTPLMIHIHLTSCILLMIVSTQPGGAT